MEPFPWHIGVFDAHCHPTDTVASIDRIASLSTRALVIMATRGQDQDAVADFANKFGITKSALDEFNTTDFNKVLGRFVIPSFGWHPWFSHHIYDDTVDTPEHITRQPNKAEHYKNIILPPLEDEQLLLSLPNPRPLSDILAQTRIYLERYAFALVGEIGLDRTFRIPLNEIGNRNNEKDTSFILSGQDGRRLSPYRVDLHHQQTILRAQLHLAGEMQRAVSVHGVAAHGMVFQTLEETWHGYEKRVLSKRARKRRASVDKAHEDEDENLNGKLEEQSSGKGGPKPFPPRICLHSYSGPPDTLRQYLHPSVPSELFFSFSRLVNFSSPASTKAVAVIKAVPDCKILVESDLHAAGEKMDSLLEEIIRIICHIKGWSLQHGVEQLASNWRHYALGHE